MTIKKPTEIPDWLAKLPGDARLNSAELNKLLGYKNIATLIAAVHQGNVPIPKTKTPSSIKTGYILLWKVSDVRNFIRAEKRKQQEKS